MTESRGNGTGKVTSSGVAINAGNDVNAAGSTIIGGDQTITHKRNVRIGLGGLAFLLVIGAGGATLYGTSHRATDAVHTPGQTGARKTLLALQDAEIHGDAGRWCYLASEKNSSTCRVLMANSFGTSRSRGERAQVRNLGVRSESGSGDRYTFAMMMGGRSYPVTMEWTGKRWELSSGMLYVLAVNNGGVFVSVIETRNGEGSIGGIPIGGG